MITHFQKDFNLSSFRRPKYTYEGFFTIVKAENEENVNFLLVAEGEKKIFNE